MEVALCFTTKAVTVNTRENSNNVCVGACVCVCVCACACASVCVCVSKKMTGLPAKLKPWTAASALLGLISKVKSYARARGTLLIYYQTDGSSVVG